MPDLPLPPTARRRRRRVALGVFPGALASWVALAGLPVAPAAVHAGTMHSEIVTLTGPGAQSTAAIGDATRAIRSAPSVAKPGWSAVLAVPAGTQAVASSWRGAPSGKVDVRGHEASGWTDWLPLQADPSDGPGVSGRNSGGMSWYGQIGVDQVEVRVAQGNLVDLQVQTMRYDPPSTTSGLLQGGTAGAEAAQPQILPRTLYTSSGWATQNSGCSGGPVTAPGGVKYAVVHHTVNANDYSESDVPAMLAAIYAEHTGTNAWCDIGYNFIVDRFGRIWEGRSGGITKAIVGAHAEGFNTGSVGVSFLGQFEPGVSPAVGHPSAAALAAAGRLIGWKLGLNGIDPTGHLTVTSGGSNRWPSGTSVTLNRISGHRDVGYTACPGQYLYDDLPTIRLYAAGAQGGSPGTTTTTQPTTSTTTTTAPPADGPYRPFKSAWGLVTQDYHDVLHRPASAADVSYWASRVTITWSPGQFTANLVLSDESDQKVGAVVRLYRAYFLRNPDNAGFDYWVNKRVAGASLPSISAAFAGSVEFTSRYGQLSNSSFVNLVYRNVLGRAPDTQGAAFWLSQLGHGVSRGQVMANFSQSREYESATADGTHVVETYEAMLQQAVPADVYSLYVGGLRSSGTSLTAIASTIFTSTAYRSRFA